MKRIQSEPRYAWPGAWIAQYNREVGEEEGIQVISTRAASMRPRMDSRLAPASHP